MMTKHRPQPRRPQRGMVLMVCLVMLLVMTLLGMSGLNSTIMQEQMVGAMKESSVALEAAESALRDGEAFVQGLDNADDFDFADGLYTAANEPSPFDPAVWAAGSTRSRVAATDIANVPDPRYYIVLQGSMEGASETGLKPPQYGAGKAPPQLTGFKVVARGQGETGTGQRIVVSYYGRGL